MSDVQMCTYASPPASLKENSAARAATLKEHDTYLNLYPYFCTATCPPVINNILPYTDDGYHAGKTYMDYLTGTMWSMLKLTLTVTK
jgi:hypothetical protein